MILVRLCPLKRGRRVLQMTRWMTFLVSLLIINVPQFVQANRAMPIHEAQECVDTTETGIDSNGTINISGDFHTPFEQGRLVQVLYANIITIDGRPPEEPYTTVIYNVRIDENGNVSFNLGSISVPSGFHTIEIEVSAEIQAGGIGEDPYPYYGFGTLEVCVRGGQVRNAYILINGEEE